MTQRSLGIAALILALFILPAAGRAETDSAVKIGGFVDGYYSYNFNNPKSMKNGPGTNFDFEHNAFSLSLAEINFQKDPAPVGFRVDLQFGPTADFVHCGTVDCAGTADTGTGVVVGPTADTGTGDVTLPSEEPYKHIQQAYVSWVTPVGLNIDFGKFVTHLGAEVIESQGNWNYTRGLLFCCAIPYYHAGLRLNYPVNEMLFVNGYVVNGWNNVVENNDMKTFGATIGITPIKSLPIVLNWVGPEESDSFKDRQVYEAIATYHATDFLSFMANYVYGSQEDADALSASFGDDLKWSGLALYARLTAGSHAFALRYERADDKDGFMFGTPDNKVSEVTLTAEKTIGKDLLTRLEYRMDQSDEKIYEDKDGLTDKDRQSRLVLGMVYSF